MCQQDKNPQKDCIFVGNGVSPKIKIVFWLWRSHDWASRTNIRLPTLMQHYDSWSHKRILDTVCFDLRPCFNEVQVYEVQVYAWRCCMRCVHLLKRWSDWGCCCVVLYLEAENAIQTSTTAWLHHIYLYVALMHVEVNLVYCWMHWNKHQHILQIWSGAGLQVVFTNLSLPSMHSKLFAVCMKILWLTWWYIYIYIYIDIL